MPGTEHNTRAGDGRLGAVITRLEAFAHAPITNGAELEANLAAMYRDLFIADLDTLDLATASPAAPALMQRLFQIRLALRAPIEAWGRQGLMTRPVQRGLRDVMRATRYASDMLGEAAIGHHRLARNAPTARAFTAGDTRLLVNPAFQAGADLPFQAGDVILVRGQAHNSAAIARIGDVDSQFSHVGIVHVDAGGAPWMVEALIEDGAVAAPLDVALDHGIGRAVLLRHRDPALAARAAAAIFAHVTRPGMARILYDFTMRLDGYDWLYCSKLIRLAFLKASDGREVLPAYTTRLDMQNRDFLRRVGVQTIETFAPGDLEIDPRFEIVAEWQDTRVTARLRTQDLIMTKLFEFMEANGYRFREDWTVRLVAWFGRFAGGFSEDVKTLLASVLPKIPPHMKRRTIAVIAMLHHTAEPILDALSDLDVVEIERSGRPLHPREVMAYMDDHRVMSHGRIGYLVAPHL